MPRPQFITCQLCGKGFGSASINIHIPQCYEKAIKQWKLDPVGPRPVMPALYGAAAGAKKAGAPVNGGGARNPAIVSGAVGFDDQPCGGGISAVRSLHSQSMPPPSMEDGKINMNLHPCSKCGRSFNYDRITYHESVCKGDQKRKVFDSSKQRRVSGEGGDSFGSTFRRAGGESGMKKKGQLGVANTPSRYTPAPAPKTNWRQQHEEFINAIRSAKRADAEAQNMWGTSSPAVAAPRRGPVASTRGPQHAPFPRSTNQGGALGTGSMSTCGMPAPAQRVPPLMAKQSESRKQNIATGGRAAQAKSSAPIAPRRGGGPPRPGSRLSQQQQQRGSIGGAGDRFSGRGYGGGGGGGRILNDNTTSIGMLQAMGQA
jgi:hypothetical protein